MILGSSPYPNPIGARDRQRSLASTGNGETRRVTGVHCGNRQSFPDIRSLCNPRELN